MIHILQECGHDFGFDFKLALYGAYSSELQTVLERFVDEEYIDENSERTPYAGFPTSVFKPSARGQQIFELFEVGGSPSWLSLATKLNEKSTRDLEATSTIFLLRSSGVSEADLQSRFEGLKPHLKANFEKAKELAEELRAVSQN
ncbi:hypothetical protein [Roseibacillus persicicus]|uniref:Uncharacterized protein n=1 Tax=Roseibacillus persicicus TaxID=454148 RepID=A0A918WFM6_9BACT|nr:hypothetical protein [Roseibacillus persicicus]GHC46809.1 hypothetical protein GCM10007100_10600 [Roseibacillus persicicus]